MGSFLCFWLADISEQNQHPGSCTNHLHSALRSHHCQDRWQKVDTWPLSLEIPFLGGWESVGIHILAAALGNFDEPSQWELCALPNHSSSTTEEVLASNGAGRGSIHTERERLVLHAGWFQLVPLF